MNLYYDSNDTSEMMKFVKWYENSDCINGTYIFAGIISNPPDVCNLYQTLYMQSPVKKGNYTGYRDFYLQRTAYVHHMVHLGVVLETVYEAWNNGSVDSW